MLTPFGSPNRGVADSIISQDLVIKVAAITLIIGSLATAGCKNLAGSADMQAAAAVTGGAPVKQQVQFKTYSMDNDYFSCNIPADWDLERDKDNDEEYKIYEIQMLAPVSGAAPTSVFVSYYARDNEDFRDHQNFISRNSKNVLGETRNNRENYEAPKAITIAGRKGFELSRERMVYLHPQTKSDESVQLKEKHYVLPAQDGFYVLHFSAPKAVFAENLPVFEKIAQSFKGKP